MGSPYIHPIRTSLIPSSHTTSHYSVPSVIQPHISSHQTLMMEYKTHTGSYQILVIVPTDCLTFPLLSTFSHTCYKAFPQTVTCVHTLLFPFDEPLSYPCFTLIFDPVLIFGDSSHFPYSQTLSLYSLSSYLAYCAAHGPCTVPALNCPLYIVVAYCLYFPQTLSTQCSPSLS